LQEEENPDLLGPAGEESKGSYLQGEADRAGDPLLISEVFHAMHVILRLKRGITRVLLSSSMATF